jgi:hypothetical protein
MKLREQRSPLQFLIVAAVKEIVRQPYISLSIAAHAALVALLYYHGNYQLELRKQEAEAASNQRAISLGSTAKRLQDLQVIKELLEKSADGGNDQPEPSRPLLAPPETPREMLQQARQLSEAIDMIDKKIEAEELKKMIGEPKPVEDVPPSIAKSDVLDAEAIEARETQTLDPNDQTTPDNATPALDANANNRQADTGEADAKLADDRAEAIITLDRAAGEVAALEAKARMTLAKHQRRREAKANGVQVQGGKLGTGDQLSGGNIGALSAKRKKSQTSVRAEIAEFLGADDRIREIAHSKTYSGPYLDMYAFGGEIPPLDPTSLVRGRGRMFGAGGEYANRVYLNTWYIIGPFPGRHMDGLFDNPSYPPEKAVLLDAMYYGKDNRLLKWRYVTAQSYPLVPPDQVEDSVYYGYTEVSVDQACDLTAWIGADDDVQVYFNDQLVWVGGNVRKRSYFDAVFTSGTTHQRDYNRTEGTRVLHFNKGRNKLFFKLSNGPNRSYFSIVLTQ